jgi:hypothetical protein
MPDTCRALNVEIAVNEVDGRTEGAGRIALVAESVSH